MIRTLVGLGLVALLAGCQASSGLPNAAQVSGVSGVSGETALRAQAATILPKYVTLGQTVFIPLGWTPVSPKVQVDGAVMNSTVSGHTLSFVIPTPKRLSTGELAYGGWGGPRTLTITDGTNTVSRTTYVLGRSFLTAGQKSVLFMVAPGKTLADLNTFLHNNDLPLSITEFAPLSGPGPCAGSLAQTNYAGTGSFESLLEQLDNAAAANPGLILGVNPQLVDGTGAEPVDPNSVRITGSAEMNASAAHNRGNRGEGILVAVMDTGLGLPGSALANNEFSGRLLAGRQFTAASQANPNLSTNTFDDFTVGTTLVGHGSQVASIAAGKTLGVAPQAQVLPVKVCDKNGKCRVSDTIRGLCYAMQVAQNVGRLNNLVINMSYGGDTGEFEQDIVKKIARDAAQTYKVLFAASSGNDWDDYLAARVYDSYGYEPHTYPAYLDVDGLVSVIAVEKLNTGVYKTSRFANRGNRIDILAPGTRVLGIAPDGMSKVENVGTSFAAPHIAGLLALWRQVQPTWRSQEIQWQLWKVENIKPVSIVLKPPTEELDGYRLRTLPDLTNSPSTSASATP